MGWYYLAIFVLALMVPHYIREDMFGFSHERIEEIALFILGMVGFAFFMVKKYQLKRNMEEKEKEKRRLQQTAKDLVESYSYIGEINRKMDMLMRIGIGLSDHSGLNKHKENELYKSIVEASSFLLKSECTTLLFLDTKENRIKKKICFDHRCANIKNTEELLKMEKNVYLKMESGYIIARSQKTEDGMRSYLIAKSFDTFQANDNNNQEILKYLASQALFLYTYNSRTCPIPGK